MPGVALHFPLPLPRSWPRRVRSAVVHAGSLATASTASAPGWAADAWNPRLCQREEVLGFRSEIARLREELRIPAQRRPHYPPTERLAILQLRAACGWTPARTSEQLLVTPLTVVPGCISARRLSAGYCARPSPLNRIGPRSRRPVASRRASRASPGTST